MRSKREFNALDQKDKLTPLVCAIQNGQVEFAKFLIANDAAKNFPNDQKNNPLALARKLGLNDLIEVLK